MYNRNYGLLFDQKPITYGDTGAFTEVRKDGTKLVARMGNHGGFKLSGKWVALTKKEIIDRIFRSREFNNGHLTLESQPIRKQWKKIGNNKALFEYYHDISDKKTCANTTYNALLLPYSV